jgi:hypothetical protein
MGQDRAHLGRRHGERDQGPARARELCHVRRLQPGRDAHRDGVIGQDRAHVGRAFRDHVDEGSARRNLLAPLLGISKLSRDDMRLLGYEDATPEIDVCESVQ